MALSGCTFEQIIEEVWPEVEEEYKIQSRKYPNKRAAVVLPIPKDVLAPSWDWLPLCQQLEQKSPSIHAVTILPTDRILDVYEEPVFEDGGMRFVYVLFKAQSEVA